MSENVTSPTSAFAAPYVLTSNESPALKDGETISVPCMTMDDWATCCQVLKSNRRSELASKLSLNNMIAPGEREWMLEKVDNELVTLSFAFAYRTETPAGVTATLKKQVTKAFVAEGMDKSSAEKRAVEVISMISPLRQRAIALYLADPPRPQKRTEEKEGDSKNEEKASMNETGNSMPPSSESSGELTQEA